jgi:hypothetical protein
MSEGGAKPRRDRVGIAWASLQTPGFPTGSGLELLAWALRGAQGVRGVTRVRRYGVRRAACSVQRRVAMCQHSALPFSPAATCFSLLASQEIHITAPPWSTFPLACILHSTHSWHTRPCRSARSVRSLPIPSFEYGIVCSFRLRIPTPKNLLS